MSRSRTSQRPMVASAPRVAFPDASVTPEWLLMLDETNGGIWQARDGSWVRVAGPPNRVVGAVHTDVHVVNTVAKTALATFAVPTDALANDVFIIEAWGDHLNNSGANTTFDIQLDLGATVPVLHTSTAFVVVSNANFRRWWARFVMLVENPTNAEQLTGQALLSESLANATLMGLSAGVSSLSFVGSNTAAENLTAGKNAVISITMGNANANIEFNLRAAYMSLIRK